MRQLTNFQLVTCMFTAKSIFHLPLIIYTRPMLSTLFLQWGMMELLILRTTIKDFLTWRQISYCSGISLQVILMQVSQLIAITMCIGLIQQDARFLLLQVLAQLTALADC